MVTRVGWRVERCVASTLQTYWQYLLSLTPYFQEKKVTIVHGDQLLLNATYPDKVRKAAAASMLARGVELVLGEYVDVSETKEVQGLATRSGKELKDADFVVSPSFSILELKITYYYRFKLVGLAPTRNSSPRQSELIPSVPRASSESDRHSS